MIDCKFEFPSGKIFNYTITEENAEETFNNLMSSIKLSSPPDTLIQIMGELRPLLNRDK